MLETVSYPTILLALLAPQDKAKKPPPDPLLATVGKAEIRLADLIDEVNRQIPLAYYHRRVPPEKMDEVRQLAFDKLVVKHLIHLDAQESGIAASEDEIRKEFDAALAKAGAHYAKMDRAQRRKLLAQLRPAVARRVLIGKNEALQQQRVPKVELTKVREIYDDRVKADPTAFMSPAEAHLLHIFVKLDPARIRIDGAEKKAKIEAALAEIKGGKPFAEVARIYSEGEFAAKGGDLGFQKQGSFRMKTLNDYAFKLKVGTTSEVIRSLHGYHLLHCVDFKDPERLPFEKMRPVIETWLNKEHAQIARGRWLAGLRKKFTVEVLRPEILKAAKAQDAGSAASKPSSAGAKAPTSRPANKGPANKGPAKQGPAKQG